MDKKFRDLLKSKRFWVGFATLVAVVITAFYPAAEAQEVLIVKAVAIICESVVGMFLIGAYTWQDVVQSSYTPLRALAQSTKTTGDDEALDLIKWILLLKFPHLKLIEPGKMEAGAATLSFGSLGATPLFAGTPVTRDELEAFGNQIVRRAQEGTPLPERTRHALAENPPRIAESTPAQEEAAPFQPGDKAILG